MIFISSCETSGDLNASYLVKLLNQRHKKLKITGIGGENLKKEKVKILKDITNLSAVGIIESLKSAIKLYIKLIPIIKYIRTKPIKLLILVNSQGINLKLLKIASKRKINIIYYFPPHISIWGNWNAKKIAEKCNYIITPFQEDAILYKKVKGKVISCMHPLAEKIKAKAYNKFKIKHCKTNLKIALFPGSRNHEIKKLLPIMLKSLKNLNIKNEIYIFIANNLFKKIIKKIIKKHKKLNIKLKKQGNYREYAKCTIAIACSGTVSLELNLLKIPTIITYKSNILTYIIAKYIFKIKKISMANIISKKNINIELLQNKCKPKIIYKQINKLINNKKEREKIIYKMTKLNKKLKQKTKLKHLIQKLDNLIKN